MNKKQKIILCKKAIDSAGINLSYQQIAEECEASPSHTHRVLSDLEQGTDKQVKKPSKNRILDALGL